MDLQARATDERCYLLTFCGIKERDAGHQYQIGTWSATLLIVSRAPLRSTPRWQQLMRGG